MKIVTVGRASDNTVVLTDEYVNDSHCRFVQHDNGYVYISDLDSVNGTFVNGLRVTGEVALNPHDTVRVGNTTLPWQSYFGEAGGIDASARTVYTPQQPAQPQCQQPQQPQPAQPQQPQRVKPDSYLAWAIISALFCCQPLGIVSIVYAAQVDGYWNRGDHDGAEKMARNARTWFWWSLGVGLGFWVLYVMFWIIWGVALGVGSAFA